MKNRKNNYIILSILILTIIFLSIGFAAFSDKLAIKSSATLTPKDEDFKVLFSAENNNQQEGEVIANKNDELITATPITINNSNDLKITGLNAAFYKPGNKVEYELYLHNIGKYTSYITSIIYENYESYENNKICTPLKGTTASLVEQACEYIKVKINIDDNIYYETTNNIENILLDINEYKKMTISIEYEENNINLDGDFIVRFGDISFNYSSSN